MTEIDLRQRVAELEAENSALRDVLEKLTSPPFRVNGLSVTENKVLGAIYRSPELIAKRTVYDSIYWMHADGGPDMKILDVMICKIRKKVGALGVKIETVWGDGWRMPEESKRLLRNSSARNKASECGRGSTI